MSKKRWKVTRVVAIEAVVMADRKWLANAQLWMKGALG